MTEPNEPVEPASTPSPEGASGNRGRRRRWVIVAAVALPVLAVAALAGTRAVASPWGHHHWGDRDPTLEEAQQYVNRWTDHVLDRLDATEEQRAEIRLIIDEALPEMLAFRRQGRELRGEGRQLLLLEPIDRVGLDRVRAEGIELADRASARGLEVFVDITEVLTPEQREQVADHWRRGPYHH